MKERHITGYEDDHGVNPFVFFGQSVNEKDAPIKLIYDNWGLEYDLEEAMWPYILFTPHRSTKLGTYWEVELGAPVFEIGDTTPVMKCRYIKPLSTKAACVVYAMSVCCHGDSGDAIKIKSRFRSDMFCALKMVSHCQYPGGFGKEGWHADWDISFVNMCPTYRKSIGWCGNFTNLKKLLNYFAPVGNKVNEQRIITKGRETKWTNYEMDSSLFEDFQKELRTLIPNARCTQNVEIEGDKFVIEGEHCKVVLTFEDKSGHHLPDDSYRYQIQIYNRRLTLSEAWIGTTKQEFDRDKADVIKYFTETNWEEALDSLD